MAISRYVQAIAGTFILLSLAAGHYLSPNWYWFTAFVGANLLQSAFTGFCPMEKILHGLGVTKKTA